MGAETAVEKVNALKLLVNCTVRGFKGCIATVSSYLDDADSRVREASVRALCPISEIGDPYVLGLLLAKFEDPDSTVKTAARTIYMRMAEKGNRRALDIACLGLADDDPGMRSSALEALCTIAPRGDQQVVSAATA